MDSQHSGSGMPVLALALLFVVASGCGLMRAQKDLARLDEHVEIRGRVTLELETNKPICVALYEKIPGREKEQLAAYQLIYPRGTFAFLRPPGTYYLFAFEDANEDRVFQPTERGGWYGEPSLKGLVQTPIPSKTDHYLLFGYRGGSALLTEGNTDGTLPLSSMLDLDVQKNAIKIVGFNETQAGKWNHLGQQAITAEANEIGKAEIELKMVEAI